jgi:trypsin-like peptidase/tetratricopeptide repeat protein
VHAGLIDPRLVKVRAGRRGSGWAIGTRGVLTARHVVAPVLTGEVEWCVVAVDPTPQAPVFDCEVQWDDPDRDLAVLRLCRDEQLAAWSTAVGRGRPVVLAESGSQAITAEVVGYPEAVLAQRVPQPELAPGTLLPAQGALSGRMPFDVDSTVPALWWLWKGMSGAAVRDDDQRVLGVVVNVDPDRQQRRLYVATLPDPTVDAGFTAALAAVGAATVLEASDAPVNREFLALLDQAGRPFSVAGVPELGRFGVRRSRTDVDTHGDPYYPYVSREIDEVLREALDRRVPGTERRALVVVGDAMAGKSRTLAEALRHHAVISGWPLLIPHRTADLRHVVGRLAAGGVVWLDDVNLYTSGLEAAVRAAFDAPVVVVGTLRADQLRSLQDSPELRVAWDVLTDDRLVEQISLEPEWSAAERSKLGATESVIREAIARGRPLGEVLGAADELRKRLNLGSAVQKALVFTVADWPRTGLPPQIAEDKVRQLWPSHLPTAVAARFAQMKDSDRERVFHEVLEWACEVVTGVRDPLDMGPTMLRYTANGLIAEDYLVGLRTTDNATIPHPIWREALDTALERADQPFGPLFNLGYRAASSGIDDIAEQAWIPIANRESDDAPAAANNLGLLLAEQGDVAGARAAFERAIESGHPEYAPMAARNLGVLAEKQTDVAGARAAFGWVILSGHAEQAPVAAIHLGALLAGQGDVEGARAAFERAILSGHAERAPAAAIHLGGYWRGRGIWRGRGRHISGR